jgi:predicted nucleotidyltransferase
LFGLRDEDIEQIKKILMSNKIKKAILFGSRAKGNYKVGSDIDIAIEGDVNKVSYALNEESNLAYFFDVVNIKNIKNSNLIEHIKRVGIVL